MALGETFLLKTENGTNLVKIGSSSSSDLQGDCCRLHVQIFADRQGKKGEGEFVCACCIVPEEVYVIFHVLQGHLKEAHSASAGVCAAQPEVTQQSSVPTVGVHRMLGLAAALETPGMLLRSDSVTYIGDPDWFLKQKTLCK